VGENDRIVPINIAQKYLQKLPKNNCSKIIEVENSSHLKGWNGKWAKLLKERLECRDF
jgi:pimeloyl-ACP methyl ester carboxylesterase